MALMTMHERMGDFVIEDASPCNTCANRIDAFSCRAFSDIPMVFIVGDNNHRKPFFGDGGIQYRAITSKES